MEGFQLSLRTKKRFVTVLLVVLAAWPLAHRYLVSRFDVSPWRFFGWAMYCQPALRPTTRVFVIESNDRRRLELPPSLEAEVRKFERDRYAWGRLHRPDELGEKILAFFPGLQFIEVEIERRNLDPASSRIVATEDLYSYRRVGADRDLPEPRSARSTRPPPPR